MPLVYGMTYVWRIKLPNGKFYAGEGTYKGRNAGVWLSKRAAVCAMRWALGYTMKDGKMVVRNTSKCELVCFKLVEAV